MKDWYASHSPREQSMLIAAGIAIVLGLIYFALLQPIYSTLDQRRTRVSGNAASLVWMQKAAGEALSLKGSGASESSADATQSPLTAVVKIFREAGLKSPDRVDPVGNNGARVQLSEVAFDKLIPVLEALQKQAGLKVKSLNVNTQRAGFVSARITLER